MTDVRSVETPTHGRVLVAASTSAAPAGWIVGFHGYAQSADDMLADLAAIPGADRWHRVSVQALNRFYSRSEDRVIANWMTRQDRELAIADNITYVERVVEHVVAPGAASRLIFAGFSQGVAMAYRAALLGRRPAAGVIALGGDIPPEIRAGAGSTPWPPVLIGAGDAETWYTADKVRADETFLQAHGIAHEIVRYNGGHVWTDEFRAATGRWLAVRT